MPLPDYSPRSDSFGNWYFGGFQMDSQVESGYGAGTSITATQTDWENFLDAALGTSNWTKTGTGASTDYYYRFANAWEPLTSTISSSSNYRFAWKGTTLNDEVYLNTATTGTPVEVSRNGISQGIMFGNSTYAVFAVANQYGLWLGAMVKGQAGTLSTSTAGFAYTGWVKDPLFPTDTTERIRNCVIGRGENNGSSGFRCSKANASTVTGLVSTNNVITCQVATPGANVTDLVVIDTNTSNLALGSLHNSLVYPGSLTVGQIYRISPDFDPDGNTEQNIWLCVGNSYYVFNGSTSATGTSSRLIRVWSNNIT